MSKFSIITVTRLYKHPKLTLLLNHRLIDVDVLIPFQDFAELNAFFQLLFVLLLLYQILI